jgi:hypothetical protein
MYCLWWYSLIYLLNRNKNSSITLLLSLLSTTIDLLMPLERTPQHQGHDPQQCVAASVAAVAAVAWC